jgi:hypothetical protein
VQEIAWVLRDRVLVSPPRSELRDLYILGELRPVLAGIDAFGEGVPDLNGRLLAVGALQRRRRPPGMP